ncbi:MAG TPA: sigma factor-like helix-turn-helix DNA-binding protein [Acidimicrobiales bacterium]|nr:sigma factor-like helix-turn-helix DNA-binding protein [Acidimicrobiales bacterium]
MERDDALRQLPEAYAAVLSLSAQEFTEEEMAERLGIPPESVAPLLRIAGAKLARLLDPSSKRPRPSGNTPREAIHE